MPQAAQAATEYLLDAWQRTILTWDVLRERGNQYLEHEKSGNPPVLVFDYETVVDGRELAKPANYALVRIKPPAGYPTADPKKRPFVVIDPRAGHGPGIGGFKIDSEIGIALKVGHPCYFVMFYPQPMPGQTIESVCSAEAQFLLKVNELHPDAEEAVRHRQLPGRLGADDARRAGAEAGRTDPARRLADLLLGRCRRQEPDALLGRAARRHLDGLARGRPRPRQVRRRLPRQQLREPQPVEHLLDQALQPVREGRHRARALPRVREVVGRPLPHEQGGDGVDLAEPLRRQQALRRRGRVVRRQASRRSSATSARRSSCSPRGATTSPRRSRRSTGSPTSIAASRRSG